MPLVRTTHRTIWFLFFYLGIVSLTFLCSCGIETPRKSIASINFEPSNLDLELGECVTVQANAFDEDGESLGLVSDLVSTEESIVSLSDVDDICDDSEDGVPILGAGAGNAEIGYRIGSQFFSIDVAVTCPTATGSGLTHAAGVIDDAETWSAVDNPHLVTGDIVVSGENANLKIESCVRVQFSNGVKLRVQDQGTLQVLGAGCFTDDLEANLCSPQFGDNSEELGRVVFESVDPTPAAGAWSGIEIASQHPVPDGQTPFEIVDSSILRFLDVEDAGPSTETGAIRIIGTEGTVTRPAIQGVRLTRTNTTGIYVTQFATLAESSAQITLADSGSRPLWRAYPDSVGSIPSGSYDPPIQVLGGTIAQSAIWNFDAYDILGTIKVSGRGVEVGAGSAETDEFVPPSLRISSGTVLRFANDTSLVIGPEGEDPGILIAGSQQLPNTFSARTIFTSINDGDSSGTPNSGDWIGIVLGPGAVSSAGTSGVAPSAFSSSLLGVEVRYAGAQDPTCVIDNGSSTSPAQGGIRVELDFTPINFRGNKVADSEGYGVVRAYAAENGSSYTSAEACPDIALDEGQCNVLDGDEGDQSPISPCL